MGKKKLNNELKKVAQKTKDCCVSDTEIKEATKILYQIVNVLSTTTIIKL